MTTWRAPNGDAIVGTLEKLIGTALISGIEDDGTPIFDGETKVDWDSQVTVTREDKIIFLDESGNQWTFDELVKDADE